MVFVVVILLLPLPVSESSDCSAQKGSKHVYPNESAVVTGLKDSLRSVIIWLYSVAVSTHSPDPELKGKSWVEWSSCACRVHDDTAKVRIANHDWLDEALDPVMKGHVSYDQPGENKKRGAHQFVLQISLHLLRRAAALLRIAWTKHRHFWSDGSRVVRVGLLGGNEGNQNSSQRTCQLGKCNKHVFGPVVSQSVKVGDGLSEGD